MLDFYDKRLQQLNTLIEITGIINSSLDTSVIRKKVIEAAKNKNRKVDIDSILKLDDICRDLISKIQILREERNKAGKNKPTPEIVRRGKTIKEELPNVITEQIDSGTYDLVVQKQLGTIATGLTLGLKK